MKKYLSLLFIAVLFILSGCSSVPITGRKQMLLVSDQEVLGLSFQQYSEYIKSAPKSSDQAKTAMVTRVGRNIANAVERYLKDNGYASEVAYFSWEFNLIKSNEVNAFCMPGGKIVVYEGILPYTRDETGLAVVVGHEVAHAVAKHANERISQQLLKQAGAGIVGIAVSKESAAAQQAVNTVFGLGSEYFVALPFSRKQELEADELGLIFMAMAGYDPRQAEPFWLRMSQQAASIPEFMSTHPSDETRIKEIRKYLPTALKYYKGGNTTSPSPAKTSEKWTF